MKKTTDIILFFFIFITTPGYLQLPQLSVQ